MGTQHIIELNGNRYDALTGKIVSDLAQTKKIAPSKSNQANRKNIDGVAHRSSTKKSVKTYQRPVQKSDTLMRKTVQKPVAHKLSAIATIIGGRTTDVMPPTKRVMQSKNSSKNSLIRRFSPVIATKPNQDISLHKNKPTESGSALTHATVTAESVVVSPIKDAIANATSHQQPKLKRPRLHARIAHRLHINPKIISTGAVCLALLLIAGFFGYQNIPNIKMRLASSHAGLHGTLPAYQPSGFRLNDISYKTGQINVSFRSNSDARNFIITQIASSWNSETLRNKLQSTEQTLSPVEVPDKGKTLFIYNDSNVTWVDGGILYKIEGDSKLNSEQLLHLANSL